MIFTGGNANFPSVSEKKTVFPFARFLQGFAPTHETLTKDKLTLTLRFPFYFTYTAHILLFLVLFLLLSLCPKVIL